MAASDPVVVTGEERAKFPVLRDVKSGESFVGQANIFLETLIEKDGKWEKDDGKWIFVVPTKYETREKEVILQRYAPAMGEAAHATKLGPGGFGHKKSQYVKLVEKGWPQEKQPTTDQLLTELDNSGFSKSARDYYGSMITAMR
jgi:hypothetical protein